MGKETEKVKRTYRKYDKDFVIQAVKLVVDEGRKAREVASSLGVHENMLHKWKKQYLQDPMNAFPGKGHLKAQDAEISRLRQELERATRDRDILKKAVAIFSKMPQ
jgi:transposase